MQSSHSYKSEDIIGLDTNVLIDLVQSEDFKQNLREQVSIDVWKIYTTDLALGEARHVLIKKRNYTHEDATAKLEDILKKFNIIKINHNKEGNELGEKWVNIVKNQMLIKKFSTFFNDCKILANLSKQANINLYFTEDQDIEKVISILKIPVRIRIVGETSNASSFEVKRFFKEHSKEKRKDSRKFWRRR